VVRSFFGAGYVLLMEHAFGVEKVACPMRFTGRGLRGVEVHIEGQEERLGGRRGRGAMCSILHH
jgi:hypothetical protein